MIFLLWRLGHGPGSIDSGPWKKCYKFTECVQQNVAALSLTESSQRFHHSSLTKHPSTISHSLFVALFLHHYLSLSFFYRQVMAFHWDWRRQKAAVIFVHSTVLFEKPEMLKSGHDHELQPRRRWASMSWPSFDLGTKFQSEWCKTFAEKPAIHRCMRVCGLHICCVRPIVCNFTVCSLHLTTLKFVFFFFVLARLMARGLVGNSVAGSVSQGLFGTIL